MMDKQETPSSEADEKPIIASFMGHDLRSVGVFATLRMAVVAGLIVIPWSFFFQAPPPEAVASALIGMLLHESGISLTKISGWFILLGAILLSQPLFAWILTLIVPGATPAT